MDVRQDLLGFGHRDLMLEPIVPEDTLQLRHCRWFLAAMRFGIAIILNGCEQESEQEERKRAQGQKEWYRHVEMPTLNWKITALRLEYCLKALSSEMEFSGNRDCSLLEEHCR
jgi:hypothetical protein